MKVVIAFGANIGDRAQNIEHAIRLVEREVGDVVRRSSLLESEPLVIPERPEFSQPPFSKRGAAR